MNEMLIEKKIFPYLEKAGKVYSFKPDQMIYFQQDISNNFYFIKKGRVRAYLINQEGKEITIEVMGEGRVFGEASFFSQSARLTSVEAINHVELIACDLHDLLPYFQESPELIEQIFYLLSQTVTNLAHQVRRLTFMQADERIADFLLEMTEHPHTSLGISKDCLPYSHQEIAECTSLQRVTVTRLLKQFVSYGWIKTQYKKILIIDRESLKNFAYKNL